MTRAGFLAELARRRVDVFAVDEQDLARELGMPDVLIVNASPLKVRAATWLRSARNLSSERLQERHGIVME